MSLGASALAILRCFQRSRSRCPALSQRCSLPSRGSAVGPSATGVHLRNQRNDAAAPKETLATRHVRHRPLRFRVNGAPRGKTEYMRGGSVIAAAGECTFFSRARVEVFPVAECSVAVRDEITQLGFLRATGVSSSLKTGGGEFSEQHKETGAAAAQGPCQIAFTPVLLISLAGLVQQSPPPRTGVFSQKYKG